MFITTKGNSAYINLDTLKDYEARGLLKLNSYAYDATYDFFYKSLNNAIYGVVNYTITTTFERLWDEVTLACRGLVVNLETGEIINRPFLKFFNNFEPGCELDYENPTAIATEKFDGSMVSISKYIVDNKPVLFVASRSTLNVYVTDIAKKILKSYDLNLFDIGITHMFELISPDDKHVVKYDFEDLVYLGSVINATGEETFLNTGKYKWPRSAIQTTVDINKLITQMELNEDSSKVEEGYVVQQLGGKKIKFKYKKYMKLHSLMSELSTKKIFEVIKLEDMEAWLSRDFKEKTVKSILSLYQDFPDELYTEIENIISWFLKEYLTIYRKNLEIYWELREKHKDDWKSYIIEVKTIKEADFSVMCYIGKDNFKSLHKNLLKLVEEKFKKSEFYGKKLERVMFNERQHQVFT